MEFGGKTRKIKIAINMKATIKTIKNQALGSLPGLVGQFMKVLMQKMNAKEKGK